MGFLTNRRTGWTNEILSHFLLSKFSFVSHPCNTSDDIGADFLCTFFETVTRNGQGFITPRNSFAIQVKSNKKLFHLDVDFLINLEIPLFAGVVDQEDLRLNIYSGECVPIFFSQEDPPRESKIGIELCDDFERSVPIPPAKYYSEQNGTFKLVFPKVTEITADISPEDLEEKTKILSRLCGLMHSNIAARTSKRYIFLTAAKYDDSLLDQSFKTTSYIFAGPSSAKSYRTNFVSVQGGSPIEF
jgi:hypothetical protein